VSYNVVLEASFSMLMSGKLGMGLGIRLRYTLCIWDVQLGKKSKSVQWNLSITVTQKLGQKVAGKEVYNILDLPLGA
jgi:hypothetical protein